MRGFAFGHGLGPSAFSYSEAFPMGGRTTIDIAIAIKGWTPRHEA